jgi:hypothetical protein
LACLAAANLYFLDVWRTLIVLSRQYHLKNLPAPLDFTLVVINIFATALVMYVVLAAARRWMGERGADAVAVMYVSMLFVGLVKAYGLDEIWPNRVLLVTVAILGSGLFAIWNWPALMAKTFRSLGVFLLPCLAVTGWHYGESLFLRHVESGSAVSRTIETQNHQANAARTALVIFDMLDYDLVFDHRMPGLSLPEFDRLRSESYFARNAVSPNLMTQEAIPSITTGKIVTHAEPVSTDDALLTVAGSPRKISWKLQPTIFSEARNAGMAVGLTGWYHPYCRLFGAMLSSCEWVALPEKLWARDMTPGGIEQGIADVVVGDFAGPNIEKSILKIDVVARRKYIEAYQRVLDATEDLLTNRSLDLVVVHMPIPHTPYIYDRSIHQLTTDENGNYLDNLALADRTLGILRRKMEDAGTWKTTNIVITADHGFRIAGPAEWKHNPTPLHVPFILKMSGASQHLEDDHRFSTILTHDLLLALLKRDVKTLDEAKALLDQGF